MAALGEVMSGYHLAPLSRDTEPAPAFDWPTWNGEASRDERFIGFVNRLLHLCQPPHPSEQAMFDRFTTAGIGAGLPFDADDLDPEVVAAPRTGVDRARAAISHKVDNLGDKVNGWATVDALGSREFFDGDDLRRAAGTMAGWGGNDKVEAF